MEKQYRKTPSEIASQLHDLANEVLEQSEHAFLSISEMNGWEERGRAFLIDLRWENIKKKPPVPEEAGPEDAKDFNLKKHLEDKYNLIYASFHEDGEVWVKYQAKTVGQWESP